MIHVELVILFILGFSAMSFALGVLAGMRIRTTNLHEELPPIYIVTPKKEG